MLRSEALAALQDAQEGHARQAGCSDPHCYSCARKREEQARIQQAIRWVERVTEHSYSELGDPVG